MSWLSSALKGDKSPLSPIVNVLRAPDRIVSSVLKGDVKKAASVAVNPFASKQETRDRTLRRAGGVVAGAVGGMVGGPVGMFAGGVAGGLKAGKGHGQLKDYATDFAVGVGSGIVAGGVAGALGYSQYGGYAGEFVGKYLAPAGSFGKVPSIAKAATPLAGNFLGGGGPQEGQPVMYYGPDGSYMYQPYPEGPVAPPDKSIITGRTQEKKPDTSWQVPALLIAGAYFLTR